MPKSKLTLGYTAEGTYSKRQGLNIISHTQQLMQSGYRGVTLFDFENQPNSINYMKALVEGVLGPGNWHEIPAQNN